MMRYYTAVWRFPVPDCNLEIEVELDSSYEEPMYDVSVVETDGLGVWELAGGLESKEEAFHGAEVLMKRLVKHADVREAIADVAWEEFGITKPRADKPISFASGTSGLRLGGPIAWGRYMYTPRSPTTSMHALGLAVDQASTLAMAQNKVHLFYETYPSFKKMDLTGLTEA